MCDIARLSHYWLPYNDDEAEFSLIYAGLSRKTRAAGRFVNILQIFMSSVDISKQLEIVNTEIQYRIGTSADSFIFLPIE